MRKWIFVLGIFICSLLFFLSGALVGYSVSQKSVYDTSADNDKPIHKASKNINPIIGRIINRQVSRLNTKTRIPTPKAVIQARKYKSMILG